MIHGRRPVWGLLLVIADCVVKYQFDDAAAFIDDRDSVEWRSAFGQFTAASCAWSQNAEVDATERT
jgi:hypothetical protein